MSEPCIGYCDPTGEGKHSHPDWPADKICDECLIGVYEEYLEHRLAVAIEAIGEEKVKEIVNGIL